MDQNALYHRPSTTASLRSLVIESAFPCAAFWPNVPARVLSARKIAFNRRMFPDGNISLTFDGLK